MAKRRVNLYLDGDVYDRVQALCERLGRAITPSAIADMALTEFDAKVTPILDQALSGDPESALQMMQLLGLGTISEISGTLQDVHTESAQFQAKARAT